MNNGEKVILSKITRIDRGISWEKSQERREPQEGSIPVLRIPNVQERVDITDLLYLSRIDEKIKIRYMLKRNDIVMVGSNGNHDRIGDVAYIDRDMECLYASFLIGIKANESVDPLYLYFVLKSEEIRKKIAASISGTTGLANVAITFIRGLDFNLPTRTEQSKIAKILSSVEQAIELTEKEVSRLEDLQVGLRNDLMFGFLEEGRKSSWENVQIPSNWKMEKIQSILAQVERPVTLANNLEYQLITVKRRNEGIVARENLMGSKILVKSYFRIKSGDFLISKRQIVHGACEIVPQYLNDSVVSNEYDVFNGTKEMDISYFSEFSKTAPMKEIFFRYSQGVDIEKFIFKTKWWLKQFVPVPPVTYQLAAMKYLNSNKLRIESTRSKLNSQRTLKKALMNDLLTGKVRVKI